MKNKSPNFEWHMVPSVLFVGLLILLFIGSIFHAFHEAEIQRILPECLDCGDDTVLP